MKSTIWRTALISLFVAATMAGSHSCVKINSGIGGNLVPTDQQFDVYYAEIPLEEFEMKMADSLSGFSKTRMTIGAIRDDEFGLTTRGCALTLVPLLDSVDFGKNAKFKSFYFNALPDTTSIADESQQYILQNINVYELDSAPEYTKYDINAPVQHGTRRIAKGHPVYAGIGDTLSFYFSEEYGKKYMGITNDDIKDLDTYLKKFPGIYIDTDSPIGRGGRINTFNLQLGYDADYYYLANTFAQLNFEAEYDGETKDTCFYFIYSPTRKIATDSLLTNYSTGTFPQYCLNVASHDTRAREGKTTGKFYLEGGGGLKPVLSAAQLKRLVEAEVSKNGDPATAVINRATVVMPFEFPDDYRQMYKYPAYMNPTVRVKYEDGISFASLTDTSSDTEDPGKLNRSTCQYSADISFHVQSIIKLEDQSSIANYNVWFLPMAAEVETTSNSSSDSSMSDYYNYLAYSSYYNSMYGGGYGYGGYGYGGYGGYDSYSNYYTYALMASYYSSSNTTTSETVMLDSDRYYKAILNGTGEKNGPMLRLTYAIPKKVKE